VFGFDSEFLQRALIAGPMIVFSLSVHEFSHAWSALKFGDDTAARMGRLTLNPLVHMDMMGSLVMVLSQFTFGWAKPVPVNLMNVRNYRTADFWISFAGPLSNIALALLMSLLFNSLNLTPQSYFYLLLKFGVQINIVLAFFNMIPLFPLDGSHMLRSILPREFEARVHNFERIAPMILLALIILPNFLPGFPGIFNILGPIIQPIFRVLL
jgi:Zn-dependent protease